MKENLYQSLVGGWFSCSEVTINFVFYWYHITYRLIPASEKLVFGWNAYSMIQRDLLCGCLISSFTMVREGSFVNNNNPESS